MTQTNLDKVTDRIRKLMNKSESAQQIGSLEEAETYALKAQELLLQYNLSQADIIEEEKSPIEMVKVNIAEEVGGIPKTEGPWMISLYTTLGHYNLCRVIRYGNQSNFTVMIFGEQHNIDIVRYLHSQLVTKIKRLSTESWKTYTGPEKRNTYLRGYKVGVVQGIGAKLREQMEAQMAKYENMPGLVKVNDQAITDKIQSSLGRVRKSSGSRLSGQDGNSRGFMDGKGMNLNKGISGTPKAGGKYLN